MRVLWISFLGSWTLPLLNEIKNGNEVGLIMPTKRNDTYEKDGIRFFEVCLGEKELHRAMSKRTFCKYRHIIEQFRPEVIHVHGTEKNLAQIQNYINDIPIVISIQGLLTGCKDYTLNYLDEHRIKRFATWKNILGFGGVRLMYRRIIKGSMYEKDILRNGKYFIGRTYWDKARIMFNNPQALYFRGEELLRSEFYEQAATWSILRCSRHTIFMPSGFNPIKGMHLAIKAIYLLKKYYPDVRLTIPGISPSEINRLSSRLWGETFIVYCRSLICKYGLEDNVVFLQRLSSIEMVSEMKKAHVFLSPSSIDNSPNAVGEATMIGVPVVTTPVGGVLSMLRDETEALFAPAGDPYMIAFQIKRIFENDSLAELLSKNAHQVALKRHDRGQTASEYLDIYREVIRLHK